MYVKLSDGNSKLGKIWSISLPPEVTCEPCVPCIKLCYARFQYNFYKKTKAAYDHNLFVYNRNPNEYFISLCEEFQRKRDKSVFRFHVSGDIPDTRYFFKMIDFAYQFPNTQIMAYTKKHYFFHKTWLPRNFSLCASFWPNWGNPNDVPRYFNRIWMRPIKGSEPRIPKDHFVCQGNCNKCLQCYYNNDNKGRDIVINEHGVHLSWMKNLKRGLTNV